jgi:hypothetical protein
MRAKTTVLEEALAGHFEDHHGFLLRSMLAHIDALSAQIDEVAARIEAVIAPLAPAVARLDEIPGVNVTAVRELIGEIGADMTRFPTPTHLVSWAKYALSITTRQARSAVGPPARATHGWPAPSGRLLPASRKPTPSSASANDLHEHARMFSQQVPAATPATPAPAP